MSKKRRRKLKSTKTYVERWYDWNVKAKVVPIVVGGLGTITPNLSKHLDAISVTTRIELLQKAALLGTARSSDGY